MTLQEHDAPIDLPIATDTSLYHPAPEFGALREERPVARVRFPDGAEAYLVTRYEDVRLVLRDPRFSRAAAAAAQASQGGLAGILGGTILGMDPPEHTRLRRLVAGAFTARRVEALRPRIAGLVDDLLDDLLRREPPVDLVEAFSLPLPVQVICELLGVPASDQQLFHGWSDAAMGALESDPERAREAVVSLSAYFATHIAGKRAHPADDLVTALIAARDEQDRLTEQELVVLCFSLLVAGHETTANQITMGLLTLLHHPEELDRLRADPDRIPGAVEELMRFVQLGSSVAALARVTTEDVELGGIVVPAGAMVLPAAAVGNRDPRVFDDPDRLDVHRTDVPHLSFGAGVHHCLGAQLARAELQEALRGLVTRLPGLRLAVPESELVFKPGMVVRSLQTMPVTW
ncbi:cytochrome P450 [Thalassiella azotivora]